MHIYPAAKRCDARVMDIYSIRKANLLRLMRGRTKAACADQWDTSPSTLSQITSVKAVRNLGDTLARKIERAERLPPGWMDVAHEDGEMHRVAEEGRPYGTSSNAQMALLEITEDDEPLRSDEVWLPIFREVEFAAGDGSARVIENHGPRERFSLSRLARYGVRPENAALATAKGDSMATAIMSGAIIGIDKGCRHIEDGKVYALDHDGMLRVKRLYRMPLGRVRVVSDNAEEYPEEVYSLSDPDAPKVLGRVFMAENPL